jgi:type III secretion protein U
MSDEKTEQPSNKKLRDARNDGETSKSTDLPFAAILLCAALGFSLAGGPMAEQLRQLLLSGLDVKRAQGDLRVADALVDAATHGLILVLPVVIVAGLAAAGALVAQVGLQTSFKPLELKFDAINPASGLKRIFSVRSLIDLLKTVLKALLIGAVLVRTGMLLVPLMLGVVYQPVGGLAGVAWDVLCKVFAVAGVLYAVIGVADYAIQHWLFIRDHKMSKDEVKRENKDSEGDPHIKNERRKLGRELATAPPNESVANANVVVVNPTHYAVALRYDPDEAGLPRVIAKGVDGDAKAIREQAVRWGVPIVGNPPLARALFHVPVNDAIPEALFDGVAAVLAWVEDMRAPRPAGAPSHDVT